MYSSPKIKLLFIVFCVTTGNSHAHEQQILFNRVNLQVQSERDVPNDEMHVLLVTEHQGKNPLSVAEKTNIDMTWAIKSSKQIPEVEIKTGSYQTYPVYKDRVIIAWRVSQELHIKSQNTAKLSKLVGVLQEKLQVRQMQFAITKQNRDRYENELVEEALQAFKKRAQIIKKHMDGKDYRIVDLHVNTRGHARPVVYQERTARISALETTAPAVETGTSKLAVTVSGSIQFF